MKKRKKKEREKRGSREGRSDNFRSFSFSLSTHIGPTMSSIFIFGYIRAYSKRYLEKSA